MQRQQRLLHSGGQCACHPSEGQVVAQPGGSNACDHLCLLDFRTQYLLVSSFINSQYLITIILSFSFVRKPYVFCLISMDNKSPSRTSDL